MLREAIETILKGADLSEEEAAGAMSEIIDGSATNVQIAAYLVALRMKGESTSEIVGSVRCLRKHAVRVEIGADAVDLCGTGGDGLGTFNVSTTAAFVVAGAGVKVAKHGNRAASSRCGSADLLEKLGVAVAIPPDGVARCVEEAGIGFMFAPMYHPAMKTVAPVRKELGVRTIFNILGPLTNPANVKRQLVGVFDRALLVKFAETLKQLGADSAVVVHGFGGYDEAVTTGPTEAAVLKNGTYRVMTINWEDYGFKPTVHRTLAGSTADGNAEIALSILRGESGPRADAVLLNSALALLAAGRVDKIEDGLALSRQSLKSGAALSALERLIKLSNMPAKG
jgi:anthranilate phosphoribosyltransferase